MHLFFLQYTNISVKKYNSKKMQQIVILIRLPYKQDTILDYKNMITTNVCVSQSQTVKSNLMLHI